MTRMITTIDDLSDLMKELLKPLVLDEEYKLDEAMATADAADAFRRAREDQCPISVALTFAKTLASKPGGDTAARLARALKEYPTIIAKMIFRIQEKKQLPTRQVDIFMVGNSLMFYLDQIIYWFDTELQRLGLDGAQRITLDIISRPMNGTETRRVTKKVPDVLDEYEAYQLMVLEDEGGICCD